MPRFFAFLGLASLLACSQDRRPRADSAATPDAPNASVSSEASLPCSTATPAMRSEYLASSLPEWASSSLDSAGVQPFTHLNPYYVTGLFDEDSLPDLAIQVQNRADGKRGVLIIHRATLQRHLLGAGITLSNGGDDWDWLGEWRVVPRQDLEPAGMRGREALLVSKPESASGYVWWNGTSYAWTQGAD